MKTFHLEFCAGTGAYPEHLLHPEREIDDIAYEYRASATFWYFSVRIRFRRVKIPSRAQPIGQKEPSALKGNGAITSSVFAVASSAVTSQPPRGDIFSRRNEPPQIRLAAANLARDTSPTALDASSSIEQSYFRIPVFSGIYLAAIT
ncbi:hypothetical protein CEXT_460761 [Caerostris extrusa]|uniref:Uncharacterized protein n=1 Tax=Caerostris extrusa TaxID=172846 RepID=A0AAV4VQX7_CAEEX|nr:hypothetical protein CEXT_460761 [Caerostris extrusa]